MALIRRRMILVGVIAVTLAVAGGRIFDRFEPALLLGAILPTIATLATLGRPARVALAAAVVAVVVAVTLAVVLAGGEVPADVVVAATDGVARVLSTEWPSPDAPDLVATTTLAIAVATTLAVGLARWRRAHLAPLVPLLVAFVAVVAASAPSGAAVVALVVAGLAALAFALFGREATAVQWAHVVAERRLVPTLAVAVVIALGVSLGLSMTTRADPRSDDPVTDEVVGLDPIEAVEALRAIEPAIDLYRVSVAADPLPARWRTAAVDEFDGDQWRTEAVLRPIGRRLGPSSGRTEDVAIEFLTDDLDLVALPGAAVTVDGSVETDVARRIIRTVERPAPGDRLDIAVDPMAAPDEATGLVVGTRPVDERAAAFTSTARALVGPPGTVLEQLVELAEVMRTQFALDPDAPGAGVQQALIERFLRDTRRGSAEQFVTGYVLLARSLGVDARVASGFIVPSDELDTATTVLRSDLAATWPEVRVEGLGWVPFDPVPPEEASDLAPQSPPPVRQTPVAPQPPIVPPAEPVTEPPEPDEPVDVAVGVAWDEVLRWVARVSAAVGLVVVPIAIAALVILWAKRRRRRRLLAAATPDDRARGAWALATDAVTDAGLTIETGWTDERVVAAAEGVAVGAGLELRQLATRSGTATFGPGVSGDPTGAAVTDLEAVERAVLAPRTRRQRLRWRLSTRSLRRRTRSPISAALH